MPQASASFHTIPVDRTAVANWSIGGGTQRRNGKHARIEEEGHDYRDVRLGSALPPPQPAPPQASRSASGCSLCQLLCCASCPSSKVTTTATGRGENDDVVRRKSTTAFPDKKCAPIGVVAASSAPRGRQRPPSLRDDDEEERAKIGEQKSGGEEDEEEDNDDDDEAFPFDENEVVIESPETAALLAQERQLLNNYNRHLNHHQRGMANQQHQQQHQQHNYRQPPLGGGGGGGGGVALNESVMRRVRDVDQGTSTLTARGFTDFSARILDKSEHRDTRTNDVIVQQMIEIIKRPGQSLGLYLREGDGYTRTNGVFVSRFGAGSQFEKHVDLLRPGDELLSLNNVDIQRMPLDDVVLLLSIPRRLLLRIRYSKSHRELARPLAHSASSDPHHAHHTLAGYHRPVVVFQKERDYEAPSSIGPQGTGGATMFSGVNQQPSNRSIQPTPTASTWLGRRARQQTEEIEREALHLEQQRHFERAVPDLQQHQHQARPGNLRPGASTSAARFSDSDGASGAGTATLRRSALVTSPSAGRRADYIPSTSATEWNNNIVSAGPAPIFGANPQSSSAYARAATMARRRGGVPPLTGTSMAPRNVKWRSDMGIIEDDGAISAPEDWGPRGPMVSSSGGGVPSVDDIFSANEYRRWTGHPLPPAHNALYRPQRPARWSDCASSSSAVSSSAAPLMAATRNYAQTVISSHPGHRSSSVPPRVALMAQSVPVAIDGDCHRWRLPTAVAAAATAANISPPDLPNGGATSSGTDAYEIYGIPSRSAAALIAGTATPPTSRAHPAYAPTSSGPSATGLKSVSQQRAALDRLHVSPLTSRRNPGQSGATLRAAGPAINVDRLQVSSLTGILFVQILEGRGIRPTDRSTASNAPNSTSVNQVQQDLASGAGDEMYCVLEVDEWHRARTGVSTAEQRWRWRETFHIDVVDATQTTFYVYAWHPQFRHRLCYKGSLRLLDAFLVDELNGDRMFALALEPRGQLVVRIGFHDMATVFRRQMSLRADGLFGVPLSRITAREGTEVPLVITRLVGELEARGLHSNGLYSLCGSVEKKRAVRDELESDVRTAELAADCVADTNVLACLLKDFLRELPEPLVPTSLRAMLLDAAAVAQPGEPAGTTAALVLRIADCLPPPNKATLALLLDHLHRVHAAAAHNGLGMSRLCLIFAPVLLCSCEAVGCGAALRPERMDDPLRSLDVRQAAASVRLLMDAWAVRSGDGIPATTSIPVAVDSTAAIVVPSTSGVTG